MSFSSKHIDFAFTFLKLIWGKRKKKDQQQCQAKQLVAVLFLHETVKSSLAVTLAQWLSISDSARCPSSIGETRALAGESWFILSPLHLLSDGPRLAPALSTWHLISA